MALTRGGKLSAITMLLVSASAVSSTELGFSAGYSFNYRIPRVDMDYSTTSIQYPGPLALYLDLFTDHRVKARIEAGWCQIMEKAIFIDPGAPDDEFVNKTRAHYLSLSPLAKITGILMPIRLYGTAGLKFDILIAEEQVLDGTVTHSRSGANSRNAMILGIRAGGGFDYPVSNWQLGLSADVDINATSITPDNAYRQFVVSLRFNAGYKAIGRRNR